MARPRRTLNRPQNRGQTRSTQMRNNTRAGRPQPFGVSFQGGLGQNAGGVGSGIQNALGASQSVPAQVKQNQIKCPVGQKPGKGPNGQPTCLPDKGPGPVQRPGQQPSGQSTDNYRTSNNRNVAGR